MTIFSTCCESPSRPNQSLLLGVKKKKPKNKETTPPKKNLKHLGKSHSVPRTLYDITKKI